MLVVIYKLFMRFTIERIGLYLYLSVLALMGNRQFLCLVAARGWGAFGGRKWLKGGVLGQFYDETTEELLVIYGKRLESKYVFGGVGDTNIFVQALFFTLSSWLRCVVVRKDSQVQTYSFSLGKPMHQERHRGHEIIPFQQRLNDQAVSLWGIK